MPHRLEQQRRFTDPRITPDESKRTWDDAAAQDSIQFTNTDLFAPFVTCSDGAELHWRSSRTQRGLGTTFFLCEAHFFLQGVPLLTVGAAPKPFRALVATLSAGINGTRFALSHKMSILHKILRILIAH